MTLTHKLKELPTTDRPRERLLQHGPSALSCIELIAIILGSGMKGKSVLSLSQELLAHFGSLTHLQEASIEDLCQVKGLGPAKAVQLKAALTLASRITHEKKAPSERLDSPQKAYLWVRGHIVHEKKEIFGVILLDARGGPLRWETISIGTLTQTLVHPREVFHAAIRYLAASLILVHNHPSGDPTPSPQDRHLTRQLLSASRSIGIPILDHIIVAPQTFASFKELGLLT